MIIYSEMETGQNNGTTFQTKPALMKLSDFDTARRLSQTGIVMKVGHECYGDNTGNKIDKAAY